MCGIAGFVSKHVEGLPNNALLQMIDIIHHRGPDDEGSIFISNENRVTITGGKDTPDQVWDTKTDYQPSVDARTLSHQRSLLALGHRRLSILDLSPGGHQPMSYSNGRYWIVFNGEIYNYQEIRHELAGFGHRFTTGSDTEMILAAYSEWGVNCFIRFVGMWAMAIYDHQKEELVLSRDRYGIKPLYYYFSPSTGLYFASEIKQFTVLSDWRARLNPERSYDQLIYSFTDHTDETMFHGVRQIPAGTYFRSSVRKVSGDLGGRIETHKWYKPGRTLFRGSFDDAAIEFRSLFERAVREHLYADVPVGTALSGGLDSSSIVCEVNRILRNNGSADLQQTFSSCSVYEQYSEKQWMDIVISHTRVDAHFIYPSLDQVFDLTPAILWHHDEPYQSQSAFLGYNLFHLARSNSVKVLLNGQGADEYLGGYSQFTTARYAGMIKRFRFASLITDIKRSQKINNQSFPGVFSGIAYHLLPEFVKHSLTKIMSSSDSIKEIIDLKKLGALPVHPFDQIPVPYKSVPDISDHLTFYSTLPKYLHWEDRNSMAHSVEARVPFLDHRIVEFTSGLPDDFLEKEGINKRVMREALSGLIPDRIKNRRDKMGFITPEEMWVRRENPGIFRKKLAEAVDVTNGIIKPGVLDYFDKVVIGKQKFDYTYWRLILFSEWIKRFDVSI